MKNPKPILMSFEPSSSDLKPSIFLASTSKASKKSSGICSKIKSEILAHSLRNPWATPWRSLTLRLRYFGLILIKNASNQLFPPLISANTHAKDVPISGSNSNFFKLFVTVFLFTSLSNWTKLGFFDPFGIFIPSNSKTLSTRRTGSAILPSRGPNPSLIYSMV